MLAEVPAIVVNVALVETNVVMVPEVLVKLVSVADADRVTVADKSDIEAVVATRFVIVPEADRDTVAERSETEAVVARRLVMVPLEELNVVMLPEVAPTVVNVTEPPLAIRLVIVADPMRPTVADKSEIVADVAASRVTVADVKVKLLIVALVAVRFVMVAEVDTKVVTVPEPTRATVADRSDTVPVVAIKLVMVALPDRNTVADASAVVRLLGFVPTSTTALLPFMVNMRLSAVLTAISAPPAKLVRSVPLGIAPGVSLFFVRIVGISMLPRSGFLWHLPNLDNNCLTRHPANQHSNSQPASLS